MHIHTLNNTADLNWLYIKTFSMTSSNQPNNNMNYPKNLHHHGVWCERRPNVLISHLKEKKMGAFLISTIYLFEYLKSFSSCSPTWAWGEIKELTVFVSCRWFSNWFLLIMSHSWCCGWLTPLCLMTAGLLSSGKTLATMPQILLFKYFSLLSLATVSLSESLWHRAN